MQSGSNSLRAQDLAHYLHPYTNARQHERQGPIIMASGDGVYVRDTEGREYLDALAGLWSVAVGFGEQRLVQAATRQLEALPYYHTFSHKSHDPGIALATKLAEITPEGLERVFFTNSGSEANDSVVKFLWYRSNALGKPEKKKIISRIGAYHGVTVAAASMTGLPWVHAKFDLPIDRVLHTDCPHHYRFAQDGESEEAFASRLAQNLEDMILREGADSVAAFIAEPIMGAGGVIVPPEGYWTKVQEVCRRHDVLIIADEVITGFGRTGKLFGCELYDIKPDILVLSKQITSSYMPLAAVVMTDAVYQAIADGSEAVGTFGHGFTGSGHPVATAVALENIKVIEDRDLVANAAAMGEVLMTGLRALSSHPLVGEVRGEGLLAAVELVADKETREPFTPQGKLGGWIYNRAHDHGLIVRNVRDAVAFCPPLVINEIEVRTVLTRFEAVLEDALQWTKSGGLA